MYGERLRIALMVPCVNSVMRPELTKMAPKGIEIYETRMLQRGADKLEQLAYMVNNLPDLVEVLEPVADIYVYGCTSGSFTKGYEFDKDLVERISEQSGKPAVSASGSLLKALQALGAKKVALATPYIEVVNQLQVKFFKDAGIEVVKEAGLQITERGASGNRPVEDNYEFAKATYEESGGADAMIISCTNFRSVDIIEKLEKEIGVPVISSNQASFWAALRTAGIDDKISGYGSLLQM